MRSISVSDDTVLLFATNQGGGSAPTDNTTVTTVDTGVEVGYCTDPSTTETVASTFVAFPDSAPNGNFLHGLGCFLCVQVVGTALVLF